MSLSYRCDGIGTGPRITHNYGVYGVQSQGSIITSHKAG